MVDVSATIIQESQKPLQPYAWVILLQIAIPNGPTLYYAVNTEAVTYPSDSGSNVYQPMSLAVGSFELNIKGTLPTINLTIDKTSTDLESYIADYDSLQGATVTILVVNTGMLDEDFSPDAVVMELDGSTSTTMTFSADLVVPIPTEMLIPLRSYQSWVCDFKFQDSVFCGYTPGAIDSFNIPGSGRIEITQNGHPYVEDDSVIIGGVTGVTPTLNGTYTVSIVNANTFKLNSTDGGDYTGTPSGGTCGFSSCGYTFSDCVKRANQNRYGAFPFCREDGTRIAV